MSHFFGLRATHSIAKSLLTSIKKFQESSAQIFPESVKVSKALFKPVEGRFVLLEKYRFVESSTTIFYETLCRKPKS